MSTDTDINAEWETTSGLPLDDVDVTVTAVDFGINHDVGALCANFTFRIDETGEEKEQSFSVGNGWDTADKGAQLTVDGGGIRKLAESSNFGRLVQSAAKLLGDKVGATLGSPRFADSWVGTQWHLGTIEVSTMNPATKEKKTRNAILFTAFNGREVDGDATAAGDTGASGAAAGASAAKTAASKKAGAKAPKKLLSTEDPELFATLVELAKGHEDFDDFQAVALETDGVDGNTLAITAVMDASVVWAAAHPA